MTVELAAIALLAAAMSARANAAEASSVILVRDLAAVAGCTSLGEVRGSSKLGGLWAGAAYDKTIRQVKERAAALGATHVQVIDSASGHTGSRMIGTAFKCGPIALRSPAA